MVKIFNIYKENNVIKILYNIIKYNPQITFWLYKLNMQPAQCFEYDMHGLF